MIRIALCEDNALQREILKNVLENYKDRKKIATVIDEYTDGQELIDACAKGVRYNIYFLDILMPKVNGIDTAQYLRSKGDPGHIIFLTAERDYAVESYQFEAFYYMIKPVSAQSLGPIMDKCLNKIQQEGSTSITVNSTDGIRILQASEINYVWISDRRAQYHLTDGSYVETPVLRVPFKTAVQELTALDDFLLCGAALLVNVSHVKDINWEDIARFNKGSDLPLPHSSADLLRKKLKK